MLIISSARYEEHTPPPGHPERPERAHVFDAVAARAGERGLTVVAPRPASPDDLHRVHSDRYVAAIAETAGRASRIDADTFTSACSYDIALLAAGACVQAVDHAVRTAEPAFALVRPPGHHAERERGMGFCLFNNAAVGAAFALARGLRRVAVVDMDVHHGNGTQSIFYTDPRVLYISTHQYPFYPGSGAVDELGEGEGEGATLNIPLEAGATDADYDIVYRELVGPVLQQFSPQLVIVSAGYDAHERDPLASMRVTAGGYAAVLRSVTRAAQGIPIALVTEGGYELTALAECLEASFAVLTEAPAGRPDVSGYSSAPVRGQRALGLVRAVHGRYWSGL